MHTIPAEGPDSTTETHPRPTAAATLAADWAEGLGEHLDALDMAAFEIEQEATGPSAEAVQVQVDAIRVALDALRMFRIDMLCTAARLSRRTRGTR